MAMRPGILLAACALLWLGQGAGGAAAATRVHSVAGNVVVERDGQPVQLTHSGRDIEPVLSPDGTFVVYTRLAHPPGTDGADQGPDCGQSATLDSIRMIKVDGSGDSEIVKGRAADEPQAELCDFQAKQFSADGSRLFFLSAAWATSGAVHVYDFAQHSQRFVLPGNDLIVLSFCKDDHRDALAVAAAPLFRLQRKLRLVLAVRRDGHEGDRADRRIQRGRRGFRAGARLVRKLTIGPP